MRLALAMAMLALVAAPLALPAASAVDLCRYYGICIPPNAPPTDPCWVNGYAVRVGTCEGRVQVCTFRYMGGGGSLLGNFRWDCSDVLA